MVMIFESPDAPLLKREDMEVRRLKALRLRGQLSQREIAAALGVTPGAVSQWFKRYREEGAAGLKRKKASGRPTGLSHEQLLTLHNYLKVGALHWGFPDQRWTRARVGKVIAEKFGRQYHESHVGRLLKELNKQLTLVRSSVQAKADSSIKGRRFTEALSAYTELIDLLPDGSYPYHRRGAINTILGQYQDATREFTEAIARDVSAAESFLCRALVNYLDHHYEDSIKDAYKAEALDVGLAAVTKTIAGAAMIRSKRSHEATVVLSAARHLDPGSIAARLYSGAAWLTVGNWLEEELPDLTDITIWKGFTALETSGSIFLALSSHIINNSTASAVETEDLSSVMPPEMDGEIAALIDALNKDLFNWELRLRLADRCLLLDVLYASLKGEHHQHV